MFELDTPWTELVLRGTMVYLALFILLRFLGKKHLGEMTPFDLLLLLIISEAVEGALLNGDKSITGGLVVVITLLVLAAIMNWLSFKSRKAEKIIEGIPKVIIRDGHPIDHVMQSERITINQLMESCREQGILKIADVGIGLVETNGKISIIKKVDRPKPSKKNFFGFSSKNKPAPDLSV